MANLVFFLVAIVGLILSILFVWRMKINNPKKIDSSEMFMFGAMIFIGNIFLLSPWVFLTQDIVETFDSSYEATVISNNHVRFLDQNEYNVEAYLKGPGTVGDKIIIFYNKETEKAEKLDLSILAKSTITFIFCLIFTFILSGELLYILKFNKGIEFYSSVIIGAFTYILIPLMLIGLNIAAIYALLFNNVSFGQAIGLIFFILIAIFSTYVYLKFIFMSK